MSIDADLRRSKRSCRTDDEGVFKDGILGEVWKIFQILESLEQNGISETKARSGEIEGPFCSNAKYEYKIKLGIENEDFPFRRGFRPRPRLRFRRIF